MKEILQQSPIIPVITIDSIDNAFILTRLFQKHDYQTIEITLRTPNALAIINALAEEFQDMNIGAGTVNCIETMEKVRHSKAKFAVSPGFYPAVAQLALNNSMPYLPGVATPSEMLQAKSYGFNYLKLFPAEIMGGIPWLKAMHSIMPEMQFCPTGGITINLAAKYLSQPNVVSVGMSALTPSDAVNNQEWPNIETLLEVLQKPNSF